MIRIKIIVSRPKKYANHGDIVNVLSSYNYIFNLLWLKISYVTSRDQLESEVIQGIGTSQLVWMCFPLGILCPKRR